MMPFYTVERNCSRCGQDFRGAENIRVCGACRKPKVARVRVVSKTLTLRQKQLVELVSQGKLNKEIAWTLHLSEGTVKTYLSAIFDKVGVTNRTELAVYSLRHP